MEFVDYGFWSSLSCCDVGSGGFDMCSVNGPSISGVTYCDAGIDYSHGHTERHAAIRIKEN